MKTDSPLRQRSDSMDVSTVLNGRNVLLPNVFEHGNVSSVSSVFWHKKEILSPKRDDS